MVAPYVPLSVLDLRPWARGASPAAALQASLVLARGAGLRAPRSLPDPEEAAEYNFTPREREVIKAWTGSHVVGSPDTARH